MGAVNSAMENLVDPDNRNNPPRVARSIQLGNQVIDLDKQFNGLKQDHDQIIARIGNLIDSIFKLDAVFHNVGFNSTASAENKVRQSISGAALDEYNSLKQKLDLSDTGGSIIWNLITITGAETSIIVGINFTPALVSSAAVQALSDNEAGAFDATADMGPIDDVPDQLRNAITQRWQRRSQIKYLVMKLQAIRDFLSTIEAWLNKSMPADSTGLTAVLNCNLDSQINLWNYQYACDQYALQDDTNDSWTAEDPRPVFPNYWPEPPTAASVNAGLNDVANYFKALSGAVANDVKPLTSPPIVGASKVAQAGPDEQHVSAMRSSNSSNPPTFKLLIEANGQEKEITLTLVKILSPTTAEVKYSGQLYKLSATAPAQPKLDVKDASLAGDSTADFKHIVFTLTPWNGKDGSASSIGSVHGASPAHTAGHDLQTGFKMISVQSGHT